MNSKFLNIAMTFNILMTGPSEGKLKIRANVFLEGKKIDAIVYVHLKGYSMATVTHLDIESPKLNLMSGKGDFHQIIGIEEGIEIPAFGLVISALILNDVLKSGEKTRTWVGQKQDGIYIGFKKTEMLKLENIAKAL
jgi:hypothetical protein